MSHESKYPLVEIPAQPGKVKPVPPCDMWCVLAWSPQHGWSVRETGCMTCEVAEAAAGRLADIWLNVHLLHIYVEVQ